MIARLTRDSIAGSTLLRGGQLLGERLRTFLAWWASGLRHCLPGSVRRWLEPRRVRVLLVADADGFRVFRLDPSGVEALPRVDGGDPTALRAVLAAAESGAAGAEVTRVLGVPEALALEKTLHLPAAAGEHLARVLEFEMDRLTPFRAADVYYATRGRGIVSGDRLECRMAAVPRETADALLGLLSGAGVALDAMDVTAAADGMPACREFNLLPADRRRRRWRFDWMAIAALAVLAVTLGLLTLHQPLREREAAIAALEAELAALRTQAEEVLALRAEVEQATRLGSVIAERRNHETPLLEILLATTRALPDNAWAEQIQISRGTVSIQGRAPTTSGLIEAVEASPLLAGASFRSPVMRDPQSGEERFRLEARIESSGDALATAR